MKKELPKFKVGDEVMWSSQASSFEKVKQGVVVGIVPKGVHVHRGFLVRGTEHLMKYNKSRLGDGYGRDHESYLVLVNDKYLYWPRVSQLNLVRV
ncbi:MAG: hypothetical protein WC516_06815 [Patescibacteria group bacterium]